MSKLPVVGTCIIEQSLHKRLRVYARDKQLYMRNVVERAVEQYLDSQENVDRVFASELRHRLNALRDQLGDNALNELTKLVAVDGRGLIGIINTIVGEHQIKPVMDADGQVQEFQFNQ